MDFSSLNVIDWVVLGFLATVVIAAIAIRVYIWKLKNGIEQKRVEIQTRNIPVFRDHIIPSMEDSDHIIVTRALGVSSLQDTFEIDLKMMQIVVKINQILQTVAQRYICQLVGEATLATIVHDVSDDNFAKAIRLIQNVMQSNYVLVSMNKEEAQKFFAQSNLDTADMYAVKSKQEGE